MKLNDKYQTLDLIRSIFGMHKIKYSILDTFNLKDINAFHINCDSLLKYFLKYKNFKDLSDHDLIITITAILINIAAHYRHYFVKSKMNVKIYFYISSKYKHEFEDVFNMMSIILKYIPGIYFITAIDNTNINVSIKYFCDKYKNNLVLTKETLDVLLVNKSISVIKSNKDKSKYYSHKNAISQLIGKDYSGNINYKLLPIIFAITGTGCTNIKGVGPNKLIKKLELALDAKNILNSEYCIEDFITDISPVFEVPKEDIVIRNFYQIDIKFNSKKYLSKGSMKRLDDCIIDKFSNNDLKDLNIKYFKDLDSLELAELMEEYRPLIGDLKW